MGHYRCSSPIRRTHSAIIIIIIALCYMVRHTIRAFELRASRTHRNPLQYSISYAPEFTWPLLSSDLLRSRPSFPSIHTCSVPVCRCEKCTCRVSRLVGKPILHFATHSIYIVSTILRHCCGGIYIQPVPSVATLYRSKILCKTQFILLV